jgi:hypothetical protein
LDNPTSITHAAQDDAEIRAADALHQEQWAYSVGVQNYIFGLPLIILERERKIRLDDDPMTIEPIESRA